MSEFGNETATATIRLTEKSLEALLKLLKYLMERNERNTELELKKQKLQNMKTDTEIKKARDYLNRKRGNVRANMLYKSGERLLPISIPMSVNELREFEKYSKIYGLIYSSISDRSVAENIKKTEKQIKATEDEATKEILKKQLEKLEVERQKRIVIIREKDLEIAKDITDRMNLDIRLNDIDKEINMAKENEENEIVEQLQLEKEKINQSAFEKFNEMSNKNVIAEIVGNKVKDNINFDKVIADVTNLQGLEETMVICERTNPYNYIEVNSKKETLEDGRNFINTEYKVYNNNEQQKCDEFNHGKFTHFSNKEGSNSEYGDKHWSNMKKEMKEKGGFTNDLLIFKNNEDYKKYLESFNKTIEKSINREDVLTYEADINSYKDCQGIINNLKGQLANHNMLLNAQMQLCDKTTNQIISINKNRIDDEKIECIEGINIVNQIGNYKKMNDLQNKIELKKMEKEDDTKKFNESGDKTSENLILYKKSQEKFNKELEQLEKELHSCNKKAEELELQQKKIKSVAIISVGIIEKEKILEKEESIQEIMKDTEKIEIETQSKEKWEKDINTNISSRETTKTTVHTQSKSADRSIE